MRGLSLSLTLQLNVQSLRQTHFSGCLTDSIHRVRMRLHSAAKASQCIESETSLSEKWQQHNYKQSKLTPRNWASLGPGLTLSRLELGSNKLSSSQRNYLLILIRWSMGSFEKRKRYEDATGDLRL
jgi:hypothetical protein